jgi:benzoylsuccinyl-CoA thiolase BbsB subunit
MMSLTVAGRAELTCIGGRGGCCTCWNSTPSGVSAVNGGTPPGEAALREVVVAGTGLVAFARYPEKTLADLAWPAVLAALRDAEIEPDAVEAAYCGTALGGMMAGQRVLKPLGMTGIPVVNTENACASSATAFREAWIAIAAGIYDVALVLGVEKLTKLGGGSLPLEQDDWEAAHGMSMPALYAMRAQRYMHDHGGRRHSSPRSRSRRTATACAIPMPSGEGIHPRGGEAATGRRPAHRAAMLPGGGSAAAVVLCSAAAGAGAGLAACAGVARPWSPAA